MLSATSVAASGPLERIQSQEEDARVIHLLNRAAFGPTPALIEEVHRVGRNAWVAEQIVPEQISDPEIVERLALYPALSMNSAELVTNYPQQSNNGDIVGIGRPQRIPVEVGAANLTRAVHGRAQLREVLTDFWFNHFNVTTQNNPTRYSIVAYLRDAIRPNALGRFEDILRASATSPAMMYYLDNYLSSRPGSPGRYSGINENYARELLELHTLGVDGGYTQEDIVEVARAFTGWAFTPLRSGAVEFVFVPSRHDPGDKVVLGQRIPSGGQQEGFDILELLAKHPSTARFISYKLIERFVTETPPADFVDRVAEVFLATDGHIGWTVASILLSEDFYDPAYRGNKAKSPYELVASALRATEADVTQGVEAVRLVGRLGQPLLRAPAPTGWPETGVDILSPGGMVGRFELGYFAVTDGIRGAEVLRELWAPILELWGPAGLAQYLLGRPPGETTLQALEGAATSGASPDLLAAIVLASPEFQLQ